MHLAETHRADLRLAKMPTPRPAERIETGGSPFLIQGAPVRDREWPIWTVDLRPR
jgi:hypothetical protein